MTTTTALARTASRSRSTTTWPTLALAVSVVAASVYGLLAEAPYRSLPETTVLGARAQDACSIVAAVLLVTLTTRPRIAETAQLLRLGLLAYLVYSYLIYVTGVPMNRMFLVYVVVVALSGGALLAGLAALLDRPVASTASRGLRHGTGWFLVGTTATFAALWLSVLVPVALGAGPPQPEGVGGTPYPVFWLDLAITLPAIAAVGVVLLRDRAVGPALAVVALVKVVTLFTALWAGPAFAAATGEDVHLGPDAAPSVVLLVASCWLLRRWLRSFTEPAQPA